MYKNSDLQFFKKLDNYNLIISKGIYIIISVLIKIYNNYNRSLVYIKKKNYEHNITKE